MRNSLAIILLWVAFTEHGFALEKDMTFTIEAGARNCFFERVKTGQLMEAQYEVIDGQHGDLDISFKILDPNGTVIVNDFKKSHNSIIREIEVAGDFVFCFDNSFSRINSKTVFLYLLVESVEAEGDSEEEVRVENEDGEVEKQVLEWMGHTSDGKPYYIEVKSIAKVMKRILKHVVKARVMLDIYGAQKSKDSHIAFEDVFIVDLWSVFQITVMLTVGLIQVYMVKQLFDGPSEVRPFI